MPTTRSCTRCHAGTQPAVLHDAAGTSEPVAVSLHDMPVLSCSAGHRQFVRPEFARELCEHLMDKDEAAVPAAEESGRLFKHYRCSGCGAELAKRADRRETFAFDVALADAAPFRVDVTAPVYRCPSCSREQVRSLREMQDHTPAALAQAFRAADLRPG
jgi:hypothetical protein